MIGPLLNPYRELFESLQKQSAEFQLELRKKLIWAFSWAIPSDEAIHRIARCSPIIELGAGTGYWAWLLGQAGARVEAYDREPAQPPRWREISRLGIDGPEGGDDPAEFWHARAGHSLLLCWPPLDSPMAARALERFKGRTLIYIGEWRGRTADCGFHDILESAAWKLEDDLSLPNWPGFTDRVRIYRRN